jgi:hypothetical protein
VATTRVGNAGWTPFYMTTLVHFPVVMMVREVSVVAKSEKPAVVALLTVMSTQAHL